MDLALDGKSGLPETVLAIFFAEAVYLQIAELRIVEEDSVRVRLLIHERRLSGPIIVEVDLQRSAAAVNILIVEILLLEPGVGDGQRGDAEGDCRRVIGPAAEDVVDVAGVPLIESHAAESDARRDWQVDHAFELAADAAVIDRVNLAVDPAGGDSQLWLVGDDADRAGFARGAVERALRAGQALNPGDVVNVDVERAANGRDRLLIEIEADLRQGTRVIALGAASGRRDAAHIYGGRARLRSQEGDRRQLFREILEIGDIELVEPPGTDRLDADRDVLEVFLAFGRGDDDLGLVRDVGRGLRLLDRRRRRRHVGRIGARSGRLTHLWLRILRERRRRKRGRSKQSEGQRTEIAVGHSKGPPFVCVGIATERYLKVNVYPASGGRLFRYRCAKVAGASG